MELLYFILVCYGMTQIIVYGSIFDRVRPDSEFLRGFGKLFHCPLCMGFHVGWVVFLMFWYSGLQMWNNIYLGCFLYGCLSSGTTYILSMLIDDYGVNVRINNVEED
mgnify:FL=1